MVQGRMPRESNPVSGEKPGYAANFDTTGNEDYERVSPSNPMPTTDQATKAELELIKQQNADILAKLNEGIDTQLTGSMVVETLINSESVAPGDDISSVEFNPEGANYCIIGVNIDQQPWFVRTDADPWGAGRMADTVYPYEFSNSNGVETAYNSQNNPATLIPVVNLTGDMVINSMIEAIEMAKKIPFKVSVWNNSDSIATVSVKIIRVYGG